MTRRYKVTLYIDSDKDSAQILDYFQDDEELYGLAADRVEAGTAVSVKEIKELYEVWANGHYTGCAHAKESSARTHASDAIKQGPNTSVEIRKVYR